MARVTLATIAAHVGVSVNTVSLALRHDPRVAEPTRRLVEAAAAELRYVPNPVLSRLFAELSRSRRRSSQGTIALLNAHPDAQVMQTHPILPDYREGCRRSAQHRGYRLDEFWLHERTLDPRRLHGILTARGVAGAVVFGLVEQSELARRYRILWENHPCVSAGIRTLDPTLPYVCVDHHLLVRDAVEAARALGYRRPGMVIAARTDRLVDRRFSAAFWAALQALPAPDRIPDFFDGDAGRADPGSFRSWFQATRPDVLLTFYPDVVQWLRPLGIGAPDDLGVILLDRFRSHPEWSCMDQHGDRVGENAVSLLVEMINHDIDGLNTPPHVLMHRATWRPGASVRRVPVE